MRRNCLTSVVLAMLLVAGILGAGCNAAPGEAKNVENAAAASPAPAADAAKSMSEAQFLAKIDELTPGMGAAKIEDRKEAQMTFERICFDNSGPGKGAARAALCKAIMQRVGPDLAMPARVWLLRKVEPIGREEVVERLTQLLADADPQIRELARRALQNNPVPQAAAALRKELTKATDSAWRVSIINALGVRRDVQSVSQISKLAADPDAAVAAAAVSALGTIADDYAIESLSHLRKKAPAGLQESVTNASFRAAGALLAKGSRQKAAAIYEEIYAAASAENVRITALQGITATRGTDALPTLLGLINGADERLQLAAARCAQSIPGEATTRQLTGAVAKAKPAAQAVLLEMLGKRGDKIARAVVVQFVNAPDDDVRAAAVGALRYIGNGSDVAVLAKCAESPNAADAAAARESLKWMKGKDVDEAILAMIPKSQGRVKSELVRAAAVRLMKPALDILLANTHDADESVRVPVIYNIGKLAGPKDLPRAIAAFDNVEGDKSRDTARDALVQIASKIPDESKRVQALTDAMATAQPGAQVTIIRALASLKGQNALQAIRKCAGSENSQVKQAAVQALADWGPVYCTQWVFAGPYKKDGAKFKDLMDEAFPPEDVQATVEWKPIKDPKGRDVDLTKMSKEIDCCGYVRTQVWSEASQDIVLTLGSDDGIKAWVNGAVVHANNVTRGFKLDEDQPTATLKQGWNTLLIKVTQGGGSWQFACGFKSPQGGPAAIPKFEAK